jgi:hypothetical protein
MGFVYDAPMTYYIPEGNIKQFEARIARLIKRAIKLKSVLTYAIDRNDFKDEKMTFKAPDGTSKEVFVRRFRVEVTGTEPKYAGWQFIGTLEHTDEGNVLRMVPGKTAPEQYRDCAPFCEHCKLKRTRKDTFLVHHVEKGTTTQVGSNCLVDFLGHENPQALAQLASIWVNLNELTQLAEDAHWMGGGGNYITKDRQDLIGYLSIVSEIVIQENQFWSRSAVNRIQEKRGPNARVPEVTAWRAARYMHPSREDYNEAQGFTPSEAAIKMADAAREWVLNTFGMPLPEEGGYDAIKAALLHTARPELNDFEHNLLVVAKGEFCERRTFGIAAYIIEAYRKANNLIPQREQKPVYNNQHFGTVGQRFAKLEVTCEKVHTWSSIEYGAGSLFKLRTAEGLAIWRTYNVSEENDMVEGRKYVIAATVKKHGEYNGEKQTEMSRVKVGLGLTGIAPAAPATQPESLEPGDDFVPTTLQLAAA